MRNFASMTFTAVAVLVCLISLVGCGGGNPPLTVSGMAATGAALAKADVVVKCLGRTEAGKTSGDGTFSIDLALASAPCMLQVTQGATVLHSFAPAAGYANVTPMTDLVVSKALGSSAAVAFSNFDAAKGDLISKALPAAKTFVATQLAPLVGKQPQDDLLTQKFVVGDAQDRLLDHLSDTLFNAGKTLADLRKAAEDGTSLAASVASPATPIASLTAVQIKTQLSGTASPTTAQQILALAGDPVCGVDVFKHIYATLGPVGEKITSTGAIMVPSGSDARCNGPRPLVLYAHGTQTDKLADIAAINNKANSNFTLANQLAAIYAGQGYIVVAPNEAGYDQSTLGHHPYLNAQQNGREMLDALVAARAVLANPQLQTTNAGSGKPTDNGKLFITGYSEGGYVAMAAHREMQSIGFTVTASAPSSGPYAIAANADAVFYGNAVIGGPTFVNLLVTGYQKAYGNIYASPAEFFEAAYIASNAASGGVETLFPSTLSVPALVAAGKTPASWLFSPIQPIPAAGSPIGLPAGFGFGCGNVSPAPCPSPANLITGAARSSYLADAAANPDSGFIPGSSSVTQGSNNVSRASTTAQHPLRRAFAKNDLRNWTPKAPVLMCGGRGDTVSNFMSTSLMNKVWNDPSSPLKAVAGLASVLDLDPSPAFAPESADAYANHRATFLAAWTAQTPTNKLNNYHAMAMPVCIAAARDFFSKK